MPTTEPCFLLIRIPLPSEGYPSGKEVKLADIYRLLPYGGTMERDADFVMVGQGLGMQVSQKMEDECFNAMSEKPYDKFN